MRGLRTESGGGVPQAGWAGVSEGFGLCGCRLLRAGVLTKGILLHYPCPFLSPAWGVDPLRVGVSSFPTPPPSLWSFPRLDLGEVSLFSA